MRHKNILEPRQLSQDLLKCFSYVARMMLREFAKLNIKQNDFIIIKILFSQVY